MEVARKRGRRRKKLQDDLNILLWVVKIILLHVLSVMKLSFRGGHLQVHTVL